MPSNKNNFSLKIKKSKEEELLLENLVQLEVRFMTILPTYLQSDKTQYKIKYNLFYGAVHKQWEEEAFDVLHTSKKSFNFDYCITQNDQKFYSKISFETDQGNFQKSSIFGDSSEFHFADIPEEEDFFYKFNACYDLHETLLLKGSFGEAENLQSNIPIEVGENSDLENQDKYEHDKSMVRASVVERSHKPMKITFALTGKFDSEKDFLMVSIYEIMGKNRKLI